MVLVLVNYNNPSSDMNTEATVTYKLLHDILHEQVSYNKFHTINLHISNNRLAINFKSVKVCVLQKAEILH